MTARTLDTEVTLATQYQRVRNRSEAIAEPFSEADQTLQSMPDASPLKWHLAHTSWFFETFLLKPQLSGFRPFDPDFEVLFNSYYNAIGEQYPRAQRGLISRPGKDRVLAYRRVIDEQVQALLDRVPEQPLLALGLAHEQQHQELMLTDILHALSYHPSRPAIWAAAPEFTQPKPLQWVSMPEGLYPTGAISTEPFAFDNEGPRHQVLLYPFKLANRLITNGEFHQFIEDGGYQNPLLWLSEGWQWRCQHKVEAPLYWRLRDDQWWQYSLAGEHSVDWHAPVRHVSYFEAQAFATWAEARLPTEFEWEATMTQHATIPWRSDSPDLCIAPQPMAEEHSNSILDAQGQLWQWTASQYLPYPGFKPSAGAVGEYNGKFMSNQFVLRGGSCATPINHLRLSYRNFFPAVARWQFTGIRLAKDDHS